MPSTRTLALGVGGLALLALPEVAAAQTAGAEESLGLGARLVIRFGVSLVVAAILGGALVGFAPTYADEMVAQLNREPGVAFGWGLIAGVALPVALVLLAATGIGLLVAVPGFIALLVVGVVGNAVTVAWLGSMVYGEGVEAKVVVAGAALFALLGAFPVLGNLLSSLVGFFGLGAVSRDLWRNYRDDGGRGGHGDRRSRDRGDGHEVEARRV